jgi:hypothetical protein
MMISIDTKSVTSEIPPMPSYHETYAIADFDVLPVACSGVSVAFTNHSHVGAAFTGLLRIVAHIPMATMSVIPMRIAVIILLR